MEVSKEELKAIERLSKLTSGDISKTVKIEDASIILYDTLIVLNLITKQQKEIDNMAEFIWKYDCCEHFKKEDENFKCEGWYINRECRENCIKPFFKKRWEE